MTKRRRRQFREMEVLETLIVHQGVTVPCFRCKEPFNEQDIRTGQIQKEHLHEFGLDGPDEPVNCRFSHTNCHSKITNGTPATTAGSSANRLAKTRPNRAEKFIPNKRPLDEPIGAEIRRCRKCGSFEDCEHQTHSVQPRGFGRGRMVRA